MLVTPADDLTLSFPVLPPERMLALQAAVAAVLANPVPLMRPHSLSEDNPGDCELPVGAPTLIGITSLQPGDGKDVIADYLQLTYRGVARLGYSQAMMGEVNEFLEPWITRHCPACQGAGCGSCEDRGRLGVIDEATKHHPPYRQLLIEWADARRAVDPFYWNLPMQQNVEAAHRAGAELVLVTGVRDAVEAHGIRDAGGVVWRVRRPSNPVSLDHPNQRQLDHLPDEWFERVVWNDWQPAPDQAPDAADETGVPLWQAQLQRNVERALRP